MPNVFPPPVGGGDCGGYICLSPSSSPVCGGRLEHSPQVSTQPVACGGEFTVAARGDVCLGAVNVLRRKRYLNRFHGVAEVMKNFLLRTAPQ